MESRVDQSDLLLHVTVLWLAKLIMNLLDQQIHRECVHSRAAI